MSSKVPQRAIPAQFMNKYKGPISSIALLKVFSTIL